MRRWLDRWCDVLCDWPGDYALLPRLAFYVVAVAALSLLGGGLACGCNLAAPLFGAERGPWLELWHIGTRCGVVGGGLGALWVFVP